MARKKKEFYIQIMGSGRINTANIPPVIAEEIGRVTFRAVLDFLKQPDGRERLEAKKAELRNCGWL